tara:strand:+ start:416 stop:601 length:186 start_codon:yes stop_codon:yes gene_type:complete
MSADILTNEYDFTSMKRNEYKYLTNANLFYQQELVNELLNEKEEQELIADIIQLQKYYVDL